MTELQLDRDTARRIAVRAQRLDAERPTDLLDLVTHLGFLQLDPTAAVAPAADLIAYTRLGAGYQPEHLLRAVEVDRTMREISAQDDPKSPAVAMVRAMSDLPLFLAEMRNAPRYASTRDWFDANAGFRQDILDRLRDSGPLLSRDIPDTSAVSWASTGWTNNQNTTRMLEVLTARGEVAASGRIGRQRTWDLAERVYPADLDEVPLEEASRLRAERRLAAMGIGRTVAIGEAGIPARVDGSKQAWRVDPLALADDARPFVGRTALLSPFDRLIHDRIRSQDVFQFEYILEMYKPAAARRWGYFALPILIDDRVVGKLDAAADRKKGTFTVAAIHQDVPLSDTDMQSVRAEIEALADWQGLEVTGI